jgi:peptide-methionine (S)-S-oxide reductase
MRIEPSKVQNMRIATRGLVFSAIAVAIALAFGFNAKPAMIAANEAPSANGLYPVKGAKRPAGKTQLAAFSAGCFWGVESDFRNFKGVLATASGFTGGHVANPSYELVCTGTTGHAETVLLEYDPTVVSYRQLLQEFWDLHDPTEGNKQGPDVGEQYRSAIWFFTPEQKAEAIASRDKLQKSGELKRPITTEILPAGPFYKAEEYHQQYVEKGGLAFCHRRKG